MLNFNLTEKNLMALSFIKPLGYYPPLLWDKSKSIHPLSLRGLIFLNLFIRFLVYPIHYIFNGIVTLGFVVAATFFNLIGLLGGMASKVWSTHTKALNQIMLTRLPWLFLDGLGFLWNQGKLFLGLFYTPLATSTLNDLIDFSEPLTKTSLFHWTWEEPHQKQIKKLANFLDSHDLHVPKMVLCTLAGEPVDSILCASRMFQGLGVMRKDGLNPVKLTALQAQYAPILCLHGNYHNQSAWLPLAEYFQKHAYPGPIFTLNLPAGNFTHTDTDLIQQKIESIKACYQQVNLPDENFKLNLIGHSRGATLAYYLGFQDFEIIDENFSWMKKDNPFIHKTILIGDSGHVDPEYRKSKPTYVNGCYDNLLFFKGSPEGVGGSIHQSGHLGLLSNPNVLEECYSVMTDKPML